MSESPSTSINPRDLFDPDFYASQFVTVPRVDLWDHYLHLGHQAGFEPSPYFSSPYFLRLTAYTGHEPAFVAYLKMLESVGDPPAHPLFDPVYYRDNNPEIGEANPWLHYALHGDADSRSPGMGFDAIHYRTCYQGLLEDRPFRHYVMHGERLGYAPIPLDRPSQVTTQTLRSWLRHQSVLLLVHDAQRAGAPLHAEMLGRGLRAAGREPIFVLKRGGPLLTRFRSLGPTFVLAEGWAAHDLLGAAPASVPVIANSAATADLLPAVAEGAHRLLLVHESADEIARLGFADAVNQAIAAQTQIGLPLPGVRDAFAEAFGIDASDSRLVVLGTALHEPEPTPKESAEAQRSLRPDARPIVAGAAHADFRKGFDWFVAVAAKIHALRPDVRILWFGDLDPWAAKLAEGAVQDGIPLELPGYVEPFQAWIGQCSALLVTSRSDPGPATALIAAAAGVPTVAFDTGIGVAPFVARSGALIPEGDIAGFAEAAIRLADSPEPDRRALLLDQASQFSEGAYVTAVLASLASGARRADDS